MLYDDLVPQGQWLCHHGIKGQKWGIRRYQNADGSLTSEGKARYAKQKYKEIKSILKSNDYNIPSREKKICESIDPEILSSLNASAKNLNSVFSKYVDSTNKAINDVLNSKKYLERYADMLYNDGSITEEEKKDRGLISNLFVEDPLLGPDLLIHIGYTSEQFKKSGDKYNKALREHLDLSKKYADEILGSYANKPITSVSMHGSTTRDARVWLTAALANYTQRYHLLQGSNNKN